MIICIYIYMCVCCQNCSRFSRATSCDPGSSVKYQHQPLQLQVTEHGRINHNPLWKVEQLTTKQSTTH